MSGSAPFSGWLRPLIFGLLWVSVGAPMPPLGSPGALPGPPLGPLGPPLGFTRAPSAPPWAPPRPSTAKLMKSRENVMPFEKKVVLPISLFFQTAAYTQCKLAILKVPYERWILLCRVLACLPFCPRGCLLSGLPPCLLAFLPTRLPCHSYIHCMS